MWVFITADISQQYIGCYRDGDDRVMTGSKLINELMTVDWCQRFCQVSAYTYFGLEVAASDYVHNIPFIPCSIETTTT